jgi:3-oxoadipate enol-lactonase
MDWMEVNGVTLRYVVSGEGKENLILVHELGGALESWDDVLPILEKKFRVLRYDQRGFGLSEKSKGTLDINDMTGDIAGLTAGVGMDGPCHVAGTAMGAGIAMAYAMHYPERVKRLVLTSPATGTTADRAQQYQDRAKLVEESGMRASVEASLGRSYPDIFRKDPAKFAKYRCRWLANDPYGFASINRMLGSINLTEEGDKVTCPTLVVGGQHDAVRPPETAKAVANSIPGSQYVLAETGHFMAVQTPELFLQLALPFLRGERS